MITVVNVCIFACEWWVLSGTPSFKNETEKWMKFFLPVNSDEKLFIHASPMI